MRPRMLAALAMGVCAGQTAAHDGALAWVLAFLTVGMGLLHTYLFSLEEGAG